MLTGKYRSKMPQGFLFEVNTILRCNGNCRFKHLLSLMGRNRDNLSDTFTEQQKELLEKYDEAVNEMHSLDEEAAFHCGFSLGVRLVMECISIQLTEED